MEALYHKIFSDLLLLSPCLFQISFTASCYQSFSLFDFLHLWNQVSQLYKTSRVMLKLLSPTNAPLYYTYKMLKYTARLSHDCSYMFRSTWTIIREPLPNLAKVTISWKYSVKIRRYMFSNVVVNTNCVTNCTAHNTHHSLKHFTTTLLNV